MRRFVILSLVVFALAACSSIADGGTTDDDESSNSSRRPSGKSSSSSSQMGFTESSSSEDLAGSSSLSSDSLLNLYVDWVKIPASSVKRGSVIFSVNEFEIGKTEVTQLLYKGIMGSLPDILNMGDDVPVANVNWYDAVLFCNALSKKVGLDTAYVYEGVGESRFLKNLSIDYSVESIRLPTGMEWEAAYRAGTTTTYYWGTDKASEYAYYAQHVGPVAVAQYKPNAFGLYDMGGNVAEWTNDWFGTGPATAQTNYTGAEKGSAKVTRGGGWSDVAKVMAADSSVKKDPLYSSDKQGLRLVHSVGF